MITGVYETVLYCKNIASAVSFYRDVLGLPLLQPPTEYSAVFRLSEQAVLLLFDPTVSVRTDRGVPAHGAAGAGHVALAVSPGTLAEWRQRLAGQIEAELTWEPGGRSIYVRDPAGNSVELVEGQVWRAKG